MTWSKPYCILNPNTWLACLRHTRRGTDVADWRPRLVLCWCAPLATASMYRSPNPRSSHDIIKISDCMQKYVVTFQAAMTFYQNSVYGFTPCKQHAIACKESYVARLPTLITLSAEPVTNHSFPGSKSTQRTQPPWPLITYNHYRTYLSNRTTVVQPVTTY